MADESELEPHPFCQTAPSSAESATNPYGTCASKSANEGGSEALHRYLRARCAATTCVTMWYENYGISMGSAGSSSPPTVCHRTAGSCQGLGISHTTSMNGKCRAEHARCHKAKGPTSLMVCGDGGQCLNEANVFLEIEELPRPYRVSNGVCILAEEQGLISSCARRDSSSLRVTARGFRVDIVKEEAVNLYVMLWRFNRR